MIKSDDTSQPAPYRLKFLPEALVEWKALDGSVREVLRKAIKKRLVQPRLPGSELHGSLHDCYKIKLRQKGYRLIYSVDDGVLIVLVLAVDKRENMAAYKSALERLVSRK